MKTENCSFERVLSTTATQHTHKKTAPNNKSDTPLPPPPLKLKISKTVVPNQYVKKKSKKSE